MDRRIFACLFLCSLLVAGGMAQIPANKDKPVWTIEFIKVKPGKFEPTLGYLDNNWMRFHEEAKHQGVVLSYYRIAEEDSNESGKTIVLLTEYKNQAAYAGREKLFDSIEKQLGGSAGVVMPYQARDLYETIGTHVFNDYTDAYAARFRLLAKNQSRWKVNQLF